MKVTFPYMGSTIIYKKIAELLGHEVIMPPPPTKKTISLGAKYSPEFACVPLKMITGTYIEAAEMGAEVVITSGGHGPCRAGYYNQVHRRILEQLGHNLEFIVFDSIFDDIQDFLTTLKRLRAGSSVLRVGSVLTSVYRMMRMLDNLDKRLHTLRAYEQNRGDCTQAWRKITAMFDKAQSVAEMKQAYIEGNELLDSIPLRADTSRRLRIGLVGEIYVVMEPSINMHLEETLGNLGCEVERSQYLTGWVEYNFLPGPLNYWTHEKKAIKKGRPYIPMIIGGHAIQTVGHIVDYAERGFDGVIHLMPFGCLPELVSQSIIPAISEKHGIPVMTLSLDEQTGVANIQTRVEAFIDLIARKKFDDGVKQHA
ncbi:MAG: hypothetical protein FH749_03805 [Firmicutes bacterium]|nr:hypothetical protein [Bacillota bacterium]